MEDRIVIKESKKTVIGIVCSMVFWCLVCLVLVVIGIFNGEEKRWLWMVYLVGISWTIPFFVYAGLSYWCRRLELSGHMCSYRNIFGKCVTFKAGDVSEIKTKLSTSGKNSLMLIGYDGKKLAVVEMGMDGYERIIPFFETYNLSAVWTEDGWIHPKPVKINAYSDELVVQANKKAMWLSGMWVIAFFVLVVGWTIWLWRQSEFGFLHISMIGLNVLAVVIGMAAVAEIKGYLKLRLVLSSNQCTFIDMYGQIQYFLLDEIESAKIVTEGIGKRQTKKILLRLSNGREAVKINYAAGIDNLTDVIPFVEYHQRKIKQ